MSMPLSMEQVLNDEDNFNKKFLAQYTRKHLRKVPPEDLRKVLEKLHENLPFSAAGSPKWKRPEQPVLTFGKIDRSGAIQKEFGITADRGGAQQDSTKLYLFVDPQRLNEYQKQANEGDFKNLTQGASDWRAQNNQGDQALKILRFHLNGEDAPFAPESSLTYFLKWLAGTYEDRFCPGQVEHRAIAYGSCRC